MLKRLFAPWRKSYTEQLIKGKQEDARPEECVFCVQFAQNKDPNHFILGRFDHNAVILNRFPYNAGHILIIPFAHVRNLSDLTAAQRAEMLELTNHTCSILSEQINAHGFNVGMNIGKAGGAGIPSHLHMHVLPRYEGDTNFLPTLGQTKQISIDICELYHKLKPAFEKLTLKK